MSVLSYEYSHSENGQAFYAISSPFCKSTADLTVALVPYDLHGGDPDKQDAAHNEALATARLFKSAPDLLKYLTITVGVLDKLNIMWMAEQDAKSAIASATSEGIGS